MDRNGSTPSPTLKSRDHWNIDILQFEGILEESIKDNWKNI